MCGRAREHRNRDRFGFYDGVERCARTGNDAIYTFAERSVFESAHVVGALRSLGVADRCTRTFYCIASLYFITSSLFSILLLPFPSLFPSPSSISRADFEFIAPKRRLRAVVLFVRSLCSDFITRHARPAVCTRVCVRTRRNTRRRASVDF